MQFVLIGLDGADGKAPARRQISREAHIARGDELLATGNLLYGAVLLHDDGNMKGSMYVLQFESEENLQKYLKTEPYVVGNVWQDITIHKSSTRDPWQFNREKSWFQEQAK